MAEEIDIVCPSCGTRIEPCDSLNEVAVCAICAVDESPDYYPEETIAPSSASQLADQSEQTLSVGPNSSPPTSSRFGPGDIPKTIGRFEIQAVLGTGGFGTVYRAHDPLLDRIVALKVPRLATGDKLGEMFIHEAKAAARLRHPNIVAVFECGTVEEKPFIASEYVDGKPLSYILKKGRIQIRQSVQIIQQLAEAIDYAHSEGVIHRDLKPSNIMMSRAARPQVMDFGLARLGSDSETSIMSEGSILGTPTYMAPEQARGDRSNVGPKSDQYSLGVMLYFMLCGQLPYRGDSWSVISRVADPIVLPETPRSVRSKIPRDLEACCMKAMEKDQALRYDSLADLADDLAHWLEGRPLLARPIGVREQFVRWCGRNRLIASLLTVIMGFIFTALIAGYLLAFKFSNLAQYANERADAEQAAKREVEQVLIDTLTESGLDAGRSGKSQEAVLWFGSAAARAKEHPQREQLNRTRFQSWLRNTPIPVRMFRGLEHWHRSLHVHPTGQYVLSEQRGPAGDDCQIWHVPSGQLWEAPWNAKLDAATWNADGSLLAIAAGTEIRLYQFPDGDEVDRWTLGDQVHQLLFSPSGNKIAIGCNWSMTVRSLLPSVASKSISVPAAIDRIAWSPTETKLAMFSDNQLFVYSGDADVSDDAPLMPALKSPYGSDPPMVAFLDEDHIVVPESGKEVRCWNIPTAEAVWSVSCGDDASCSLAPDKRRLAIIDRSQVIQVDARTGEPLGPALDHPNLVYSARYDSSGTQVLTGCADQFARVFSADSGEEVASMRHSDIVHRVAWMPSGRSCVTSHWKADLVRVWKLGVITPGFTQPLPGGVMHAKWSRDGKYFLPTGMDLERGSGDPQVLNVADGNPTKATIAFGGRVSDGCFIPEQNIVFLGGAAAADETADDSQKCRHQDFSRAGKIVAANFDTGELLFPALTTESNVIAIDVSRDGKTVIALCYDHVLIIDSSTGEVLHRHETFPGKEFFYGFVIFRRLRVSLSGDRFVIWGSRSRTAEVRSTVDGSLLFTASHTNDTNVDWLHDVAFSPDGKTLATCSADQTVQIWNAESGQKLPAVLRHAGWVFSATFSQDGKRLLTACQDRQARLWDLSQPDKPIMATPAQSDEVYATCFLPGEDAFLIGLRDGEVSAWDTRQGKMIAPATSNPGKQAIYTLSLSPDQSRVVIVSRDPQVRGFHPARWQPEIDTEFSRLELQMLGEIIASQELQDGVMIGLTDAAMIQRWQQLYDAHPQHQIFRLSDAVLTAPIKTME